MTIQSFNVGSITCYYSTVPEPKAEEGQFLKSALEQQQAEEGQFLKSTTEPQQEEEGQFLKSTPAQDGPSSITVGTGSQFQIAENVVNEEPGDLPNPQQHLALQEIQAADKYALWDPKKLFLTFDDRVVFTLSEVDLENFFHKEYPGCIVSVTLSQDSKGYLFGTIQLQEGHNADELLNMLPSKFYKVRGQWVKTENPKVFQQISTLLNVM